jgi:hypothetical protein
MTKIELKLAADQAASNATNAKAHADHATEHITANDTKEIKERNSRVADEFNKSITDFIDAIDSGSASGSDVNTKVSNINDILAEIVSARIDKEQLDNVTVKALVVNDLVGEGLEHYGGALNNATTRIVNEADYQSSQAAVSRSIELYNEIKPSGNSNASQLADSLNTLKTKIDNKSPFDEVDKTVDDKISPVLNDMFKLNLAEEEGHTEGENHGQNVDNGGENQSSSENQTHETNSK